MQFLAHKYDSVNVIFTLVSVLHDFPKWQEPGKNQVADKIYLEPLTYFSCQ